MVLLIHLFINDFPKTCIKPDIVPRRDDDGVIGTVSVCRFVNGEGGNSLVAPDPYSQTHRLTLALNRHLD